MNYPLRTITFAHSPDPDDAYMFYGFETGAVKVPGIDVRHHLQDIQSLNERALKGEFEITAVSAHAYAYISDRYWIMSCGASVGRGYGPTLITRSSSLVSRFSSQQHETRNQKPETIRIAIPGQWTTAALMLDLWLKEQGWKNVEKVVIPFDHIIDAVKKEQFDAGLIIHEGQLTYESESLQKIWNAGEWWKEKTHLPLPLGLDVVRKDLGRPLAQQLSRALRDSILYAKAHPQESLAYALQFGRGLDQKLGQRFIDMYVNEDTLNQGEDVQQALHKLFDLAVHHHVIPTKPPLEFI